MNVKKYLEFRHPYMGELCEVEVRENISIERKAAPGMDWREEKREHLSHEDALNWANSFILKGLFDDGFIELPWSQRPVMESEEIDTKGKFAFCKEYTAFYDFSELIEEKNEEELGEYGAYIYELNPKDENAQIQYLDHLIQKLDAKHPALELRDHIAVDYGKCSASYAEIESINSIRVEWESYIYVSLKSYDDLIKKYGNKNSIRNILEQLLEYTDHFDLPALKVFDTDNYEMPVEIDWVGESYVLSVENNSGAELQEKFKKIDSFSHAVSTNNYKSVVSHIKRGLGIDEPNQSGETALMIASGNAFDDTNKMIKYLLKNGANVNVTNKEKETPLIKALKWGDEERVMMLVKAGADLTVKDKDNDTIFHWACRGGGEPLAKKIIDLGVDVNVKGSSDFTPLHWACYEGHKNIVELLLAQGADINAQNDSGATALHLAAKERQATYQMLSKDADGNEELLSETTKVEYSPQLELVIYLIENGADPKIKDNEGKLPSEISTIDVKNYLENSKSKKEKK
jgi:ankyrin repeat protein